MGILKGSLNDIIEKQLYKKFYMHSPGHWIGLDVHDVGNYKIENQWIELEKNMCLTIEPGIYIADNEDNIDIDKKWKGIGVRIEDDILIRDKDNEILSQSVP